MWHGRALYTVANVYDGMLIGEEILAALLICPSRAQEREGAHPCREEVYYV